MEMNPKTLRALAKAAGLKPMVFFRLSPEQVLEAVKEHDPETYKDLETWPDEVAVAHMGTLAIDKGKELVEEKETSSAEPVEKVEEKDILNGKFHVKTYNNGEEATLIEELWGDFNGEEE